MVGYSNKYQNYNGVLTSSSLSLTKFAAVMFISIVYGFRYMVGMDWFGYVQLFYYILDHTYNYLLLKIEPGYFLINKIVGYLGYSYTILFIIIAGFTWILIFKRFPTQILPFAIYFLFTSGWFFWSMNGVRQFIAIVIIFYSANYINLKQFRYYLFHVLFASMFHFSALPLIVLYFIPYNKIYNPKFLIILFIVAFAGANIFSTVIISFLNEHIEKLGPYATYFVSNSEKIERLGFEKTGLGYFLTICVSITALYFSNSLTQKHPQLKIYFVLMFLGTIFSIVFVNIQLFERFILFFKFFQPISLSYLVWFHLKSKQYTIISLILILSNYILFIKAIINSADKCSPYLFDIHILLTNSSIF